MSSANAAPPPAAPIPILEPTVYISQHAGQSINIGDVVFLSQDTGNNIGYLHAEGFKQPCHVGVLRCGRDGKDDPAEFRACLFEVVPKQSYVARDTWRRSEQERRNLEAELLQQRNGVNMLQRQASSFTKLTSVHSIASAASIKRAKEKLASIRTTCEEALLRYDRERERNANAARQLDRPIKNGEVVQLLHLKSGKYLTLVPSEEAMLDPGDSSGACFKVTLSGDEPDDRCALKFEHGADAVRAGSAAFGSQMDEVTAGGVVNVIEVSGHSRTHLHVSTLPGGFEEVNLKATPSPWRIHLYRPRESLAPPATPSTSVEPGLKHGLHFGCVLRIQSDITQSSLAASSSGHKPPYLQSDRRGTAKQIFILESSHLEEGGCVRWGDEVRLRHLPSGLLVAVHSDSNADKAVASRMTECECTLVACKDIRAQEQSIFNLMPVGGGRTGTPISQVHTRVRLEWRRRRQRTDHQGSLWLSAAQPQSGGGSVDRAQLRQTDTGDRWRAPGLALRWKAAVSATSEFTLVGVSTTELYDVDRVLSWRHTAATFTQPAAVEALVLRSTSPAPPSPSESFGGPQMLQHHGERTLKTFVHAVIASLFAPGDYTPADNSFNDESLKALFDHGVCVTSQQRRFRELKLVDAIVKLYLALIARLRRGDGERASNSLTRCTRVVLHMLVCVFMNNRRNQLYVCSKAKCDGSDAFLGTLFEDESRLRQLGRTKCLSHLVQGNTMLIERFALGDKDILVRLINKMVSSGMHYKYLRCVRAFLSGEGESKRQVQEKMVSLMRKHRATVFIEMGGVARGQAHSTAMKWRRMRAEAEFRDASDGGRGSSHGSKREYLELFVSWNSWSGEDWVPSNGFYYSANVLEVPYENADTLSFVSSATTCKDQRFHLQHRGTRQWVALSSFRKTGKMKPFDTNELRNRCAVFLEYVAVLVNMLADVCSDRCYEAIQYFGDILKPKLCIAAINDEHLHPAIRAAFAHFALQCFVQHFPHYVEQLPRFGHCLENLDKLHVVRRKATAGYYASAIVSGDMDLHGSKLLAATGRKDTNVGACTTCIRRLKRFRDAWKGKVLIFLDGKYVMFVLAIMVVFSLSLLICEYMDEDMLSDNWKTAGVSVTCIFIAEVVTRMWAMGPAQYFRDRFCCVDFVVSIIDIVGLALDSSQAQGSKGLRALRIARFVRIFRLARFAKAQLSDEPGYKCWYTWAHEVVTDKHDGATDTSDEGSECASHDAAKFKKARSFRTIGMSLASSRPGKTLAKRLSQKRSMQRLVSRRSAINGCKQETVDTLIPVDKCRIDHLALEHACVDSLFHLRGHLAPDALRSEADLIIRLLQLSCALIEGRSAFHSLQSKRDMSRIIIGILDSTSSANNSSTKLKKSLWKTQKRSRSDRLRATQKRTSSVKRDELDTELSGVVRVTETSSVSSGTTRLRSLSTGSPTTTPPRASKPVDAEQRDGKELWKIVRQKMLVSFTDNASQYSSHDLNFKGVNDTQTKRSTCGQRQITVGKKICWRILQRVRAEHIELQMKHALSLVKDACNDDGEQHKQPWKDGNARPHLSRLLHWRKDAEQLGFHCSAEHDGNAIGFSTAYAQKQRRLSYMVSEMQSELMLPHVHRDRKSSTSYKTVSGSTIVDWLLENGRADSRESAVVLGQRLLEFRFLRDYDDKGYPFGDNACLFCIGGEKMKAVGSLLEHPLNAIDSRPIAVWVNRHAQAIRSRCITIHNYCRRLKNLSKQDKKNMALSGLDGPWGVTVLFIVVLLALTLTFLDVFGVIEISDEPYYSVSKTTTAIFIVEVSLRMWSMGGSNFIHDRFCIMDLLVTVVDVVTVVLELATGGEGADGKAKTGTLFRALRILRILRVLRVLRLMRYAKKAIELREAALYSDSHLSISAMKRLVEVLPNARGKSTENDRDRHHNRLAEAFDLHTLTKDGILHLALELMLHEDDELFAAGFQLAQQPVTRRTIVQCLNKAHIYQSDTAPETLFAKLNELECQIELARAKLKTNYADLSFTVSADALGEVLDDLASFCITAPHLPNHDTQEVLRTQGIFDFLIVVMNIRNHAWLGLCHSEGVFCVDEEFTQSHHRPKDIHWLRLSIAGRSKRGDICEDDYNNADEIKDDTAFDDALETTDTKRMRAILHTLDGAIVRLMLNLVLMNRENQWALTRHFELILRQVYYDMNGPLQVLIALFTANPTLSDAMKKPIIWQITQLTDAARQEPSNFPPKTAVHCIELLQVVVVPPRIFDCQHFSTTQLGVPNFLMQELILQAIQNPCFRHMQCHIGTRFDMAKMVAACQSTATAEQRDELEFHERLVELLACCSAGRVGDVEAACVQLIPLSRTLELLRSKQMQSRPSLLRAYCLYLAEVFFDTELQPTGWHALVADTRAWQLLAFCANNWLQDSSAFTQWSASKQRFVAEGVLPMLTAFFTFVWDSTSELNGEMKKTYTALMPCIVQLVESGNRRVDVAAFTTAQAMKLRLSPSLEAKLSTSAAAVKEQEELEHDLLREIHSPAHDILRELTYSIEQSSKFREHEERLFDSFVQNLLDSGNGMGGNPAQTEKKIDERTEVKADSDKNTARRKIVPNVNQIIARMITFMRCRFACAAQVNESDGTSHIKQSSDKVNRTEIGVAVLRTLCRCATITHPQQSAMRAVEKGELPPYYHHDTPHTSSDAMLKFKQMQVKLVEHGAAEMVVEIVAHCPDNAIVDATLHMGTILVYGGNIVTQRRFEHVFRHADSSEIFFSEVQRRLRQRDAEVVASFRQGICVGSANPERQERRTAERHMMLFLQNLCEGHFEPLQLMLLEQPFNIQSHNLLVDCVSLLCAHVPVMPGVLKRLQADQAMHIVLVLTLLVESVEGPCFACQNTIVETGSALEALSRLITNDLGLLSETNLLLAQKVKLMATKMLVSLLEGQYADGRLHNLVGDVVPPIMLKRKMEDNYRLWPEWIRLYRPEPSTILSDESKNFETELMVVLGEEARDLNALASLLSAKDESYKRGGLAPKISKDNDQSSMALVATGDVSGTLQVATGKGVESDGLRRLPDFDANFEHRYAKAYLFFNGERLSAAQPKVDTVEFVWSGHLETALYIRPRLCQQMTPHAMSALLQQINYTPGTKIRDFMLLVKRTHREMVHRDRLTKRLMCGIPVAKFMVTHLKTIRKLVLTLSLTINCFVLLATRLSGDTGDEDSCNLQGYRSSRVLSEDAHMFFFLGSVFLPNAGSPHTQEDICMASRRTDILIKSIAGLQLFLAVLTVTIMACERFPVEMEIQDSFGLQFQRRNIFAFIAHKLSGHKTLANVQIMRHLRAIARDLAEAFTGSAGLLIVVGCFTAVVKITRGTVSKWIIFFTSILLLAIMPGSIRRVLRKLKAKGAISSGGWATMYCIIFDTLQHRHLWFYLLYCLVTIAGMVFSPFFYSLQLFEIVLVSATLQNVVKAITSSAPQLGMTALMALVMIYMFASFGFFFVTYNLRTDEGKTNFIFENGVSAQSILECFLNLFHHALVESGGTLTEDVDQGEQTSSRTRRFLFDIAFFVVFIVLLLNMIFGIIIDKFGSLRDAQLARKAQQQNYCFICDISKQKFDIEGLKHGVHAAFDHHVQSEHSLRNYFDLFIYLLEKDPANYTGADTYLRDCLDHQKLDWVPLGRSLTLDRFSEMEARANAKQLGLGTRGTGVGDGTDDNDGGTAPKQQDAATAGQEVEARPRSISRGQDSVSSPLGSPMATPTARKRSLSSRMSSANVAEGMQQGLQLHMQQQGIVEHQARQLHSIQRMQHEQDKQRELLEQCIEQQRKHDKALETILQLLAASTESKTLIDHSGGRDHSDDCSSDNGVEKE